MFKALRHPKLKTLLILFLVEFLLVEPFLLSITGTFVQAESGASDSGSFARDEKCYTQAARFFESGILPDELDPEKTSGIAGGETDEDIVPEDEEDTGLEGGEAPFLQEFDLLAIKKNEFIPESIRETITGDLYVQKVMEKYGPGNLAHYQNETLKINSLVVCDSLNPEGAPFIDPALFDPFLPLDPDNLDLFGLLEDPSPKIVYKNELDYYALTGEVCNGGLADNWKSSSKPCPNFKEEDDIFANGVWDAPKADKRILRTLVYLISDPPRGAGREHIRVKRIIQYGQHDILAPPKPEKETTSEGETLGLAPDTTNTDGGSALALIAKALSAKKAQAEEPGDEPEPEGDLDESITTPPPDKAKEQEADFERQSKCYINPDDNPASPERVSTCLDIDEVDKVRVGTKLVKKRLFGNNSTDYKYEPPFPLKVAWQSDKGLAENPPPDFSQLNLLGMADLSINRTIIELLNQHGLGDLELDVSNMDINNLADVGLIIGQSIIEQLLGAPRGSMKGWGLASLMNSLGRAYLEQYLGLLPGALSEGKDYEDLVRNIGRVTMEFVMEFPKGSFKTKTGSSQELLENIGRRYMEQEVFKVSEGTLIPKKAGEVPEDFDSSYEESGIDPGIYTGDVYPIATLNDLMERLGEGALEYAFKLPRQSLRKKDYDSGDVKTSFRESSYKASLLFARPGAPEDLDMDDYITSKLNLSFVPVTEGASRSRYGFSEDDFKFPVTKVQKGTMSLSKFKQLIGSKVIENRLGQFVAAGVEGSVTRPPGFGGGTDTFNGRIPIERWSARYVPGYFDQTLDDPTYNNVPEVDENITRDKGDTDVDGFPIKDWCSGQRREFLKHWVGGGVGPGADPGSKVREGRVDLECIYYNVASQTKDLDVLDTLQKVLFSPDKDYRYVFTPNPNGSPAEPVYDSKVSDPNRTYNENQRGYYIANTSKVPTNTVAPFHSDKLLDDDPLQEGKTVYETIQSLPFLASDSDFNQRLNLLSNLYTRDRNSTKYEFPKSIKASVKKDKDVTDVDLTQRTKNYFDLTPLVEKNGESLDQEIINRINRLTSYPAPAESASGADYHAQYLDPELNGWIFSLQDLKNRLGCSIKPGAYTYDAEAQTFYCKPSNNTADIRTQEQIHQVQEIIKHLDTLLTQMNALVGTYINLLDRGSKIQTVRSTRTGSTVLQGQSGMSAAIGLPGQIYGTDSNGRFSSESVKALFRDDPARGLVAPAFLADNTIATGFPYARGGTDTYAINIRMIGLTYAARKFSPDPLVQRRFMTQLRYDGTVNSFNQATKNFLKLGLNDQRLQERGMGDDDFYRLFQLGLAGQVFDRVGKEEMLRVFWQTSGASKKIKNSREYKNLIKTIDKTTTKISFYTTRLADLNKMSEDLIAITNEIVESGPLKTELDKVGAELGILNYNASVAPAAKQNLTITNNWRALNKTGREFEPALKRYFKIYKEIELTMEGKKEKVRQAYELYQDITHTLQEIASGKQLPRPRRDTRLSPNDQLGSSRRTYDELNSCVDPTQVLQVLTRGKMTASGKLTTSVKEISDSIFQLGLYVGSCRVDQGFGFPNGSLYTWYVLGNNSYPKSPEGLSDLLPYFDGFAASTSDNHLSSLLPINITLTTAAPTPPPPPEIEANLPKWREKHWTLGNLKLAIGIANARQKGEFDQLDMESIYDLGARQPERMIQFIHDGDLILRQVILAKLVRLIPGLGNLLAKQGITDQDLVRILQGDVQPLIAKIGGRLLDRALNLPPGTGALLAFPRCFDLVVDPRGGSSRIVDAPCDNAGGVPSRDPENVRLLIMARLGLRRLGLTIPTIPIYFDLTGSGNLLQNWGNARLTQDLGIEPNSFKGKFNDLDSLIRVKNSGWNGSEETLINAFGLSKTPFQQVLTEMETKMMNIFVAETKNQDSAGLLAQGFRNTIETEINSFRSRTTLQRLYEPAGLCLDGYWALDTTRVCSAQTLAIKDFRDYYNFTPQSVLSRLWKVVGEEKDLSLSTLVNLRKAIIDDYGGYGSGSDGIYQGRIASIDYSAESTIPSDFFKDEAIVADKFGPSYSRYILNFRNRVEGLESEYDVAGSPGQFQNFLKGNLSAEVLSYNIANNEVVKGLVASRIDDWINQYAPDWVKDLGEGFKLATKGNGCKASGDGFTLGQFFTDMLLPDKVGYDPRCQYAGLGKITGENLLFDPTKKDFRLFVFDRIFAHTFSSNVEKDLGIQQGTFKAIAAYPQKASQILITQGVLKASNQLFGNVDINHPCRYRDDSTACSVNKLKGALKSAFLAGFYDPARGKNGEYTLDFKVNRAVADLNISANKEIDRQLARAGKKYLGNEITRADLALFIQGDGRFFTFLGLQYTINLLNQRLDTDPKTRGSPKRERFKIAYADVRASTGLETLNPAQQRQVGSEALTDYQLENICQSPTYRLSADCYIYYNSQPTFDGLLPDEFYTGSDFGSPFTDSYANTTIATTREFLYDPQIFQDQVSIVWDIMTQDKGRPPTEEEIKDYLNTTEPDPDDPGSTIDYATLIARNHYERAVKAVEEKGVTEANRRIMVDAQERLKFKTLDMAAFMLDQSIPVNFAARVFRGNDFEKATTMGEYAFNLWAKNDPRFAEFCRKTVGSADDCARLADFTFKLGEAFTGAAGDRRLKLESLLQDGLFERVDSVFSQWVGQVFGIRTDFVPRGLFKGIVVWGMDGFKGKDFNRQISIDSICGSGSSCPHIPAVGLSLQVWGIQSITTWADKQLSLKPGTAQKIYQLGAMGVELYKITRAGDTLSDLLPSPIGSETRQDKVTALKAALVKLAIDIVVNDLLGKELVKLDSKLGLPPSTMAQVMTIGLTAAAMLINIGGTTLIPFDPTTLIIFGVMLGITLVFGVVKVIVTPRGTADGYYPFYVYGTGEGTRPPFPEHKSGDSLTGLFDPTKQLEYKAGLKKAAQEKVRGLIRDILDMPQSAWAASRNLTDFNETAALQIFTYSDSAFNPLDDPMITFLMNKNAPWDSPPGAGMGLWESKCDAVWFDENSSQYMCNRTPWIWSGVHVRSEVYDHVSISW